MPPSPCQPLGVGCYLGQVETRRDFGLGNVSLVRHDAPCRLPMHAHDWPFVSLLLAGTYASSTPLGAREYRHGVAVYHPPGFEHHDAIGAGGGQFFCVQLDPEGIGVEPGRATRPANGLQELTDCGEQAVLHRLACALADGQDALGCDSLLAELAAELWHRPACSGGPAPPWMKRVTERLHEEGELPGLRELAADAGVHATTLARHFRRHHGMSVGEYRARVRVSRTFRDLCGSRQALACIGSQQGYADQAHMSREFRRLNGCSPGRVRRWLHGRA